VSPLARKLIGRASPPVGGMTQTLRNDLATVTGKAIHLPSGDQLGALTPKRPMGPVKMVASLNAPAPPSSPKVMTCSSYRLRT
jgi:hypothetical protein